MFVTRRRFAPVFMYEQPDPPAGGAPPAPPAPPEPPRTFTQEELDRIVQDRLSRERSKFSDYDDLKAAAARLAEIERASQTELEQAQEAARVAAQERDAAVQRAHGALRRASIISAATAAGAVDPDAVVALIADDAVTIDDAGQVTGADTAVKQLLESKPYLVGGKRTPAPGSANGGPQGTPSPAQWTQEQLDRASAEEIDAAFEAGLLSNLLEGK